MKNKLILISLVSPIKLRKKKAYGVKMCVVLKHLRTCKEPAKIGLEKQVFLEVKSEV